MDKAKHSCCPGLFSLLLYSPRGTRERPLFDLAEEEQKVTAMGKRSKMRGKCKKNL